MNLNGHAMQALPHRRKRSSLRRTLLVLLSLIWSVMLTITGISIYRFIANNEESIWQERLQEQAHFSAGMLGEFLEDTRKTIRTIGNLSQTDGQANQVLLRSALDENTSILEMVWLDERGRVVQSVFRDAGILSNLVTIPQSTWFLESHAGRQYISSVQVSPDEQPYLIMSQPLSGQHVLAARIKLSLLWDLTAGQTFGNSGQILVLNDDGQVIAARDPELALNRVNIRNRPGMRPLQAALGVQWQGNYTNFTGQQVSAISSPVSGTDWTIVAEVTKAEETRVSRSATWMLSGGLLVVGGLILAGIWLILHKIVLDPIDALHQAVLQIEKGDLDYRVAVRAEDEIGVVAHAFNHMAAELQRTLGGLAEQARDLQASQKVTFAASETTDPQELLSLVANLIRDQFNLYHAQVFLVDRSQHLAVLHSSTGYAGLQMNRTGYTIPLDHPTPVTTAIESGEPVMVQITHEKDNYFRAYLPESRSELVLPLVTRSGVLGVLDVHSRYPERFSENMVQLFATMTEQVARAFENSDLYTETTRQAERLRYYTSQLSTAAEVARRINAILDPGQLIHEVCELLQNRFGYYHVYIYLLDENEETLTLRAASDQVGKYLMDSNYHLPAQGKQKSLIGRCARLRQAVQVNDVSLVSDFRPNPLLPETRSEFSAPLLARERLLGVLDIQDDQVNRFTHTDVDVLSTLAGQIGVSLENARLFEELQHITERLRELDRLKSEFLATMSHELRTPLNSVIGYAEVLLMTLADTVDEDTLEDVRAIYDNGYHLLAIINDVLDLAKIEAGRMALKLEDIDVETLLDDVVSKNRGLLLKLHKDLELRVNVSPNTPFVRADRLRLGQVLNNLLSNAIKFTNQGWVELRAHCEDGATVIEVQDTGTGISPENLEAIFDKFRQLDGSARRKVEGTGLGLTISRSLVEMHGGTLQVSSQIGQGSIFTVRLPNILLEAE